MSRGCAHSLWVSLMLMAFAPADAQAAPCGTWSPGLTAAAHSTRGSSTLTYSWSSLADCDGFSLDHYLLCRAAGASAAAAPETPTDSDAECTADAGPFATSTDDTIHRSSKGFGVTIFACENAACTDWYEDGAGTGEVIHNDTSDDEFAYGLTQAEIWKLVDVTNGGDSDRVVSGSDVISPAALFYPADHDHEDKLGLWWSDDDAQVWHRRADDTGNQDWNTYTGWAASAVMVAESKTGTTDYTWATHPWVVAADDGTNFVRLFLQTEDSADPGDPRPTENHIFSVDSTDVAGADFGIECTDAGGCTSCAYEALCDYEEVAVIEVCAGGGTGCTELDAARHGKILWDYIADGALDFDNDVPGMVFTGEREAASCYPGYDHSDIHMADWDPTGAAWDIEMVSGCAEIHVAEQHDPGVIPLPGGEFKMYSHTTLGDIRVQYWDPVAGEWGDSASIEVVFDDGSSTSVSNACLENVETLVRKGTGLADEVMFARALAGTGCFSAGGIIYAEHTN